MANRVSIEVPLKAPEILSGKHLETLKAESGKAGLPASPLLTPQPLA
jgi:hypothetical protein